MTISLNGTTGIVFPDSSLQAAAASPYVLKNRIINGAMVIDQRNAGAAVTAASSFPVDRFIVQNSTDGAFSAQQDSSAPAEFVNSVKITTTTADATLTTTQQLVFSQNIEGFNVADLGFGTASAKTVTVSFWVRSSLTGTFAGSLRNSTPNRSYPFTYTISSADTWEYKSVTIAGDTTGTWLTTNNLGMRCTFSLGSGPDRSGTAGAWVGANYASVTGAVSVIGTLNATWYITGVQLEVGTSATPFERRLYNQELANCQRYYYKIKAAQQYDYFGSAWNYLTTANATIVQFPVQMRTAPTALQQSGTASDYTITYAATATTCSAVPSFNQASVNTSRTTFTVTSGLTQGHASAGAANTANGYLAWSAEL